VGVSAAALLSLSPPDVSPPSGGGPQAAKKTAKSNVIINRNFFIGFSSIFESIDIRVVQGIIANL
jgi:hypothetical protein